VRIGAEGAAEFVISESKETRRGEGEMGERQSRGQGKWEEEARTCGSPPDPGHGTDA
jgi:hypothetical protein